MFSVLTHYAEIFSGWGGGGGGEREHMPKIHAISRTVNFPSGKKNNTYTVRLGFVMPVQLQALKCKKKKREQTEKIHL